MLDFLRRGFVADVNTRQQSFLSSLNLYAFPRLQLQRNSPTFDCLLLSVGIEIVVAKFEKIRIHL